MYAKSLKPIVLIAMLAIGVSCGTKKDDKPEGSSESEMKSLGLSGVIDVKVPDTVSGKSGSSLMLAGGPKSIEACQLREQVKNGLQQISDLGDTLCRIESFKEIQFGKKYNIKLKFPEGAGGGPSGGPGEGGAPPSGGPGLLESQPSMQLWVDNSKKNVVVYRCLDNKLVDMIKVRKEGDKRYGRFVTKGSFTAGDFSNSFHASATFFKDGDKKTDIVIRDKMTSKFNGVTDDSARMLVLKLVKDGVSEVASSFAGKFGGQTMNFMSVARFGENHGAILQKFNGNGYRTYFDGDLTRVNASAHPDQFGAGKPYDLKPKDMPKKLATNFTPKGFPAGAWDCSGTEDLELTITEETIKSCSAGGFDIPEQSCSDGNYGFGDPETLEESEFSSADDFEGSLPDDVKDVPAVDAGE